ncbi:Phospholipase/carboxylesterase/thioesterase [Crepidotus variabilis]|uniref:Acyl-protein thioesterase 1 n=1 Tax=Crepidotus variabilis TaxID=179855 RepID=A0A9P6ETV2_9AGAR|nr:Phospholipase/carboxylesterase/thioesterase [Crepidotus variabilis]
MVPPISPSPAPLVIPAVARHSATIIFVHGLGDTAEGVRPIPDLFRQDSSLQHVKWILPNSPTRTVTANMDIAMPSWFDIYSFGFQDKEDEEQMIVSAKYIQGLVKKEIESGTPANRIVLSGFSQGGAMALLTTLTGAERLAGIGCLSGWLPMMKKFKDRSLKPIDPVTLGTPVFMTYGSVDPLVSNAFSKNSFETLIGELQMEVGEKGQNKGVSYNVYSGMGHTASPEVLNDFKNFLKGVVPVI